MDIILKLNEAFESFMSYFNGRKESIAFLGIYFLVLIYIWFQKDKEKIQMLIPMSVFLAATVFNFLVMEYLVIPLGLDTEWYRMYWLVPVIPVVAYGVSELVNKQAGISKKVFLVVLSILCITLSGQPVWRLGYHLQDNPYKVRNTLIDMVNIIHEDCEEETIKVLLPEDYYINEIRQYDASIIMSTWSSVVSEVKREYSETGTYELTQDDVWQRSQEILVLANMCNMDVGKEEIYRALYITSTKYVVCDTRTGSFDYFLAAGCEKVGDAGQYSVLKANF